MLGTQIGSRLTIFLFLSKYFHGSRMRWTLLIPRPAGADTRCMCLGRCARPFGHPMYVCRNVLRRILRRHHECIYGSDDPVHCIIDLMRGSLGSCREATGTTSDSSNCETLTTLLESGSSKLAERSNHPERTAAPLSSASPCMPNSAVYQSVPPELETSPNDK